MKAIGVTTSSNLPTGPGVNNSNEWYFTPVTTNEDVSPGAAFTIGTFGYTSGTSDITPVDFTLSFTDPTDTLTFTGAIKYDTSSDPWFTYSGSPQTLGAYTVDFDTSTTGWYNSCSALGASSCYSLANKSVVITGILTGPTSSVPEPASAGMMLLAALGLLAFGWKRKLFASKQ